MLDLLDSSLCGLDGKIADPCPFEAIQGLTTEEAIQLLEIELYMRHTMSQKVRDRLAIMCSEQTNIESCLKALRITRLRMDLLLKMCHTSYLFYNPSKGVV